MYVEIAIPNIEKFPSGFPQYWAKTSFMGGISLDYRIVAWASTYVRLVEAGLTEYRLAQPQLRAYWDTHHSVNLSAFNRAISHFEACITDMHRAILCFNRLRRHRDTPQQIKDLFSDRPSFAADAVADRLREVRHAILHMDEQLLRGAIPLGAPFVLFPDGPETPIADEQPGQSLKVIDRLKVGALEISFAELAGWLTEMGDCAQRISEFEPQR